MAKTPTKNALSGRASAHAPPASRLHDWNLLRTFITICDAGTLTEAAKRLGTTQPNMGRHLRELERLIGETLFVRLPGRLVPNERAQSLYAATVPMNHAVRDAERLFSDSSERIGGVVRLAVAETYAYHVIPQLLSPMLNEQPELEIELSVSNLADNLLRRDADMAVRFFRPTQDGVIARKLGDAQMGLYAHESYLARYGEPTDLTITGGAFVTGFDRHAIPIDAAIIGGSPSVLPRFRFRSDSVLAHQAAVECGGGIGMYFVDIAATRPGLKRVLADRVNLPQEVWLCAHDELRRSSRMRYVWDRLGDALEARLARQAPLA